MRKTLLLTAALGLTMGGLTLGIGTAALADSAWTGGDNLPTSPLACDNTPGEAAAQPYDGGQPTGAPDLKGKPIKVVDVPKLIGIGYFNATSKGIADAAKEMGSVDAKTDGPTKANIDEQITFIDNYITSGVNGILFAANDPVAIAPVLKKARRGHSCRRLRRQFVARRSRVVRQSGRVQRYCQIADRLDGEGDWRGRLVRHRYFYLHHAEPGALDQRDAGLPGGLPSEDEVA